MTRPDYTDITFVLDRSGSMQSCRQATLESFNAFLEGQHDNVGDATMTLVQFDTEYEIVYEGIAPGDAPPLTTQTFQPRGGTALIDAMVKAIRQTGKRLAAMPEKERPGTVLFVTLTDGEENSSREFSMARLNEMISEQRNRYSWQFLFLGANQDAIATAAHMGIHSDQALTFAANEKGIRKSMAAVNKKFKEARTSSYDLSISAAPICFEAEDRADAMGKD